MDGYKIEEKFRDIGYLREGNPRQRMAWEVLSAGGVFARLTPYGPLLAGTVPLGIDVPGSDLDIVCRFAEMERFADDMRAMFGGEEGFRVAANPDSAVVTCNFEKDGFPVEIYAGQGDPAASNAFRHMLAEYRILRLAGGRFREEVVGLKCAGTKTEPAFASLLCLEGDPYDAVLGIENRSDRELRDMLRLKGYV